MKFCRIFILALLIEVSAIKHIIADTSLPPALPNDSSITTAPVKNNIDSVKPAKESEGFFDKVQTLFSKEKSSHPISTAPALPSIPSASEIQKNQNNSNNIADTESSDDDKPFLDLGDNELPTIKDSQNNNGTNNANNPSTIPIEVDQSMEPVNVPNLPVDNEQAEWEDENPPTFIPQPPPPDSSAPPSAPQPISQSVPTSVNQPETSDVTPQQVAIPQTAPSAITPAAINNTAPARQQQTSEISTDQQQPPIQPITPETLMQPASRQVQEEVTPSKAIDTNKRLLPQNKNQVEDNKREQERKEPVIDIPTIDPEASNATKNRAIADSKNGDKKNKENGEKAKELADIQPRDIMDSEETDVTREGFITNETKMLLLPNDDLIVGQISPEAKMEEMDFLKYAKIYQQNYKSLKTQNYLMNLQSFIQKYYPSGNNGKVLSSDQATNLAFKAIESNNLFTLNALLDNYSILQAKDTSGNNLLHKAIFANNYFVAKYLIIKGINLSAINYDSQNVLDIANQQGNINILFLLKKAKNIK